jgi:hypothetical protein
VAAADGGGGGDDVGGGECPAVFELPSLWLCWLGELGELDLGPLAAVGPIQGSLPARGSSEGVPHRPAGPVHPGNGPFGRVAGDEVGGGTNGARGRRARRTMIGLNGNAHPRRRKIAGPEEEV